MAAATPRRSARVLHVHTPKMSERKKSLFQSDSAASRESLTKHRQLTVLDSESESDDCDLGIMGTLDSSSCDENDPSVPKTPERSIWRKHFIETRSQKKKLLKETQEFKNFIKSPFTLKKYQTRYSCPDSKCTGSLSTPATPHIQHHPGTPSSTHSCTSVHTTSSTSSRARKSLASLIADTESCSSSLKDLNFDTDSGTDTKENTLSINLRRSSRRHKITPKLQSFKGVLLEQTKNASPKSPMRNSVVSLIKMDMEAMSPTQLLKTPHTTSEASVSPPKLGHNRRSIVQIEESPECDSERCNKRLNYDDKTDNGPTSKNPRLETSAPKARLSLFSTDRLKEILSTKSFYGKSNPDMNVNVCSKISNAVEASQSHRRRLFPQSSSHRRKRRPGQINLGVRHRIRKPKIHKNKIVIMQMNCSGSQDNSAKLNSTASSMNSTTQNDCTSQEMENIDPFDKEKQTIEGLLSQWNEEEVPESELIHAKSTSKPELACFNKTVIEETSQIFQPITAIPVSTIQNLPKDSESVIIELGGKKSPNADIPGTEEVSGVSEEGQDVVMSESDHAASHGDMPKAGQFLPVEGGYILVEENVTPVQEVLPDLDEIEREMRMLDEQILRMAATNNIDAGAVLASIDTAAKPASGPASPSRPKWLNAQERRVDTYAARSASGDGSNFTLKKLQSTSSATVETTGDKSTKLFPIFNNPNPGTTDPNTPNTKGSSEKAIKKTLLKNGSNQYVIDAGQKKFGATQCTECGVIYQIGDPQDEHDHLVHHNSSDVLKFSGLKEEFVVGRADNARCIRVRGGEPGWKKVEALLARVIHPHLGYNAELPAENIRAYTAYLYIDKKQIVGCLICQPKMKAHRLIPGDPDCVSVEEYPVKCGVSRIWTHMSYRRRGLAARLLDCARASFLYGAALQVTDLAFSAPTAAGKALAAAYCGTNNFYVYLD